MRSSVRPRKFMPHVEPPSLKGMKPHRRRASAAIGLAKVNWPHLTAVYTAITISIIGLALVANLPRIVSW